MFFVQNQSVRFSIIYIAGLLARTEVHVNSASMFLNTIIVIFIWWFLQQKLKNSASMFFSTIIVILIWWFLQRKLKKNVEPSYGHAAWLVCKEIVRTFACFRIYWSNYPCTLYLWHIMRLSQFQWQCNRCAICGTCKTREIVACYRCGQLLAFWASIKMQHFSNLSLSVLVGPLVLVVVSILWPIPTALHTFEPVRRITENHVHAEEQSRAV